MKAPSVRPLNTAAQRENALDMAIIQIMVATRNEPEAARGGPDGLRGAYLEFGVYRGQTFIHACHRIRELVPWMRCIAFDSFAGLPALQGPDADGEFTQGQFACTQADFEKSLRKARIDPGTVSVVPGWFDEVLNDETRLRLDLQVASIVYIDCDLYASCVPVLRFLTPLVRPGSILLFDDWYCFKADPNRGVRRATREWLAANPELTLERWHTFSHHGQAFIVQRTPESRS